MKKIVITGATRGIGRGLALEFLKSGHSVWITGRTARSVGEAVADLAAESGNEQVEGRVCDVTNLQEIKQLWKEASATRYPDIWINNAGINHMNYLFHQLDEGQINRILETNITGTIMASKIALEGMLQQGYGAIYNMEGFGSRGRIMKGMSIYGTSKRAIGYFTRSLVKEYRHSPVIIGSISPGMVVTDMLTEPLRKEPEKNRQALKVFHILSDPAERVTPWLVKRILKNKKQGVHISWLTNWRITRRFVLSVFYQRKVEGLPKMW